MKKIKRLIVDAEPEFHQRIKIWAARRNISMRLYITRAILKNLLEDEKYYEG